MGSFVVTPPQGLLSRGGGGRLILCQGQPNTLRVREGYPITLTKTLSRMRHASPFQYRKNMLFLLIGGHRHAVPVPGVASRGQQLGRDIQHTLRITQQGLVQGFNSEKSDLRFEG